MVNVRATLLNYIKTGLALPVLALALTVAMLTPMASSPTAEERLGASRSVPSNPVAEVAGPTSAPVGPVTTLGPIKKVGFTQCVGAFGYASGAWNVWRLIRGVAVRGMWALNYVWCLGPGGWINMGGRGALA